jgi:hypothetical protein
MHFTKILFNLLHWESWHYHLKYIPIAPVWLWYCVKAKSLWFFTASNPTITFGGFEGEGKQEIYEQLPQNSYPKSIYIKANLELAKLESLIIENEFNYPFVVKPDVGLMGYMFRKISCFNELKRYHEKMPVAYLIQEFIDFPIEVSVFYYRMPGARKGTVSGFLMKQSPQVTGDGKSTLSQLIQKNKDLKYKQNEMKARHRERLEDVLPKGEKLILSYASNRSQGGKLVSLSHEIDKDLVSVFDRISHQSKHFYYGRYDIKCASIEKLKQGIDFSILEYNGAGAGIQHVYGNGLSLLQACSTILKHWKMLYQISSYNHKANGIDYYEKKKGKDFLKSARQHIRLLKRLDTEFPVY